MLSPVLSPFSLETVGVHSDLLGAAPAPFGPASTSAISVPVAQTQILSGPVCTVVVLLLFLPGRFPLKLFSC